MLDLAGGTTVYLSCGVTDLRKSYNGLAAIIKLKFHLDPYSRCMFAFCNRRRTSIKILQWDGSGFWILMKRLDRNAFHWPDTPDELRQVTLKEIQLLKDKQKELEFLNAMRSDRLTLAQRKQFGASSEKYAEGYEQMNLFNEAEASADAETEELFEEIRPFSYKRKKEKERRKKTFPILRPLRPGPINWKGKLVTVRNAEKNTM